MENVVYALIVSMWMGVAGERGNPNAGVIGPLQVVGVATGATVLVVGTAALVAYGAYAWWGQTLAASDATGDIHVGRGKKPEEKVTTAPARVPMPAPETQVPTPEALNPDATPPPSTENTPPAPSETPAPQP